MKSITPALLALLVLPSLTACKPPQEENFFNKYSQESAVDGVIDKAKIEEPNSPSEVAKVKEVDPNKEGSGEGSGEGSEGERPEYGSCDFNLSVTSANKSKIKIVIGNREVLKAPLDELEKSEKDFIYSALDGKEPLQTSPYQLKANEEVDGVVAAMSAEGLFKSTRSHGQRYLFYAEEGMTYDTTSSKSDRLVIYAHKNITVDTTSYNIAESVFLLETQDLDIDVCLRNTSAGSIDLLVDAPGSNVRVVSKGTSFKDQKVSSRIARASKGSQSWSGTSYRGSVLSLTGEADYNETNLKFTSISEGHVDILHKGEDGLVSLEGTSVKNDPAAYISVENQAENGTKLLANVMHSDKGGYRNFEKLLLNKGELEVID